MTKRDGALETRWLLVLGFSALVLFFGGIGTWASSALISGAVIAQGRVEHTTNSHIVSHPSGGAVERVFVRNGQSVKRGQLLIQMDSQAVELKIRTIAELLARSLVQKARFESQQVGANSLQVEDVLQQFPSGVVQLLDLEKHIQVQSKILADDNVRLGREIELESQKARQTNEQIIGFDVQIEAVENEVLVIHEDLTRLRSLQSDGLAGASSVSSVQKELFQKKAALGKLIADRGVQGEKLSEHELSMLTLQDKHRKDAQRSLEKIEPEILNRTTELAGLLLERRQLKVLSPIDGITHDLKATGEGFVIPPGKPVLMIIPSEEHLRANVRVKAADIDQVYFGQEVNVRFRAINTRSTQLVVGTVSGMSAEVIFDAATKTMGFEVLVSIPQNELSKLNPHKITNGMEVTAFIQTQTKTPIEYVMRPINEYFSLALKDR